MKKSFKLNVKPVSVNSAYYARNKKFNDKARLYRSQFFLELMQPLNKIDLVALTSLFNKKIHCFSLSFQWLIPFNTFYTQDNYVSRRSMDVDNVLKLPIDFFTNSKYDTAWLNNIKGKEAKLYKDLTSLFNVDIDDQFMVDVHSSKRPHHFDNWSCVITIELLCNKTFEPL